MANIGVHPAPGLGDLMAGWFAVPQNSITDGITYTPGIGDILPGSFVVPQNPIKDYTKGITKIIGQAPGSGPGLINGQPVMTSAGTSGSGCGCGGACGGGGGCSGGLGQLTFNPSGDFTTISNDLSAGNYMNVLTDSFLNLPVWGWLAIGVVFATAGGSNSHVSRARRAAAAY